MVWRYSIVLATYFTSLSLLYSKSDEIRELLGRQNEFENLLSARARIQLAPKDECGGWCVGSSSGDADASENDGLVWNVHLGTRCQSIALAADIKATANVIDQAKLIAERFKSHDARENVEEMKSEMSPCVIKSIPIRWRLDLSVQEAVVILPGNEFVHSGVSDVTGNHLCLTSSLDLCVQPDPNQSGNVSLTMILRSNVVLYFSGVELNVLEPVTLSANALVEQDLLQKLGVINEKLSPLNHPREWVSVDLAALCESDVVLTGGVQMRLSLRVSPIVVNVSPSVLLFATEMKDRLKSKAHRTSEDIQHHINTKKKHMSLQVNVLVVLLNIRNDTQSLADASFIIRDIECSVTTDARQSTARISAGEVRLHHFLGSCGLPVLYTHNITSLPLDEVHNKSTDIGMHIYASAVLCRSDDSGEPSTLELTLCIGKAHYVLIPSFLQCITQFLAESKGGHRERKKPNATEVRRSFNDTPRLPLGLGSFTFNVTLDGAELMIPSQDIRLFLEMDRGGPMSLVSLQWTAKVTGIIIASNDQSVIISQLVGRSMGKKEEIDAWKDMIATNDDTFESSSLLVVQVDCRTTFGLARSRENLYNEDDMWRWKKVKGDEQYFVSPFPIRVIHSCVVCRPAFAKEFGRDDSVAGSYSLQIDIGDVDVMWHIAKSRFGLSDAYHVTVLPSLELFKEKKPNQTIVASFQERPVPSLLQIASPIQQPPVSNQPKSSNLRLPFAVYKTLESALITIAIRIEGIRLTCVPSNATQVTSSPIIKTLLSEIRGGATLLACPSSGGVMVLSKSATSEDNCESACLYIASWADFQLSAQYHNRRLVAWGKLACSLYLVSKYTLYSLSLSLSFVDVEPLVEPWSAHVKGCINLSELFNMEPYLIEATVDVEPTTKGTNQGKHRDFKQLIRSVLVRGKKQYNTEEYDAPNMIDTMSKMTGLDLCYSMQSLVSPDCLRLARHPAYTTQQNTHPAITSVHGHEMKHLLLHGLPLPPEKVNVSAVLSISNGSAKMIQLSPGHAQTKAASPLNVNITGALVDNGSSFMLDTTSNPSDISPHYIINNSGLTMRWKDYGSNEDCESELKPGSKGELLLRGFPHRSYISLELYQEADPSRYYKAIGRINVDLVGLKRHALKGCAKRSSETAWVFVRVQLRGSAKIVSVESPFWLSNASRVQLKVAIRGRSGDTIWQPVILPRGNDCVENDVPIPVDIVPLLNNKQVSWHLALADNSRADSVPMSLPPFPNRSTDAFKESQIDLPVETAFESISVIACSIRRGDALDQKMVLFRGVLSFVNHLPYSVAVQVHKESTDIGSNWLDIGEAGSGQIIHSPLARQVDFFRVKVLHENPDLFPTWSSHLAIKSNLAPKQLTVVDQKGVPLRLSVSLETNQNLRDVNSSDNIRDAANALNESQTVLEIYVPFILVDSARQSLEFKSGATVIGQHRSQGNSSRDLGLSNIQKHSSQMKNVDTYMIEDSSSLAVRQRVNQDISAPWSDAIAMTSKKSIERIVVPRPMSPISRPIMLCTKRYTAPNSLGGSKTMVILLQNQYSLSNQLPCDIEIISTNKWGRSQKKKSLVVRSNSPPVPIHFDDSGFIRLRPTEIGKNREVLMHF